MDRKELVRFLNELQIKFPVNTWKYNNIDIWPALKIKLFFLYLNKYIETATAPSNTLIKPSRKNPITKFFQSLFYFFVLKKKKKSDKYTILLSSSKPHYSKFENGFVNRFFYPFERYIQKENLQDKIQLGHWSVGFDLPKDFQHAENTNYVEKAGYFLFLFNKLKTKFTKNRASFKTPNFQEFYKNIETEFSVFFKNENELRSTVEEMMYEIDSYKKIYKKLIPSSVKVILEVCYYYTQHYGLNAAAKELAIPTIEIMHGGMGVWHPAYSGWENTIVENGYNILPAYMWLWDKASHKLVEEWVKKQAFHKAFLGGNTWIDMLIHRQNESYTFPAEKKIILVTMQWYDIDQYIYDAIRHASNEYEWWIRCHPARMIAKENVEKNLKEKSLTNKVNLEKANTYPLPIILKNAHVHISAFSGSIIEASLLNIPSIIISNIGAEAYSHYVQEGICKTLLNENAQELVQIINHLPKYNAQENIIAIENAYKKVISLLDQ